MLTRDATVAAASWCREALEGIPELVGALLAGSTRARPPERPHPETSDVDVWVIVDAPVPDSQLEPENRFATRKLAWRGLVLERGFFPWERVGDPARVLGDPYLAPNLAEPAILLDPSGRLARVAAEVGPEYPRRAHVRRRIDAALEHAAAFCGWAVAGGAPPGYQPWVVRSAQVVSATVHAAAAAAVAALRQPSPRRAHAIAGEVLARHGRRDLAEELLAALGSARLGRAEVLRALAELEEAYDAAVQLRAARRTVFGMGFEVCREHRAFALGGVRELVEAGYHREAMFRLAFLRFLAQTALENDAPPEVRDRFREGWFALLALLGIESDARHAARVAALREFLPRLRAGCEEVLAGTPEAFD
jgi:hypothetical protein